MKRTGVVSVSTLLLILGCSGAETGSPPDQVLVDVTVIDGTGAAARTGQTIEIRGGRITAVRPSVPTDRATIDVAGSFVTPGLIDVHVHLPADSTRGPRLERMLGSGITSVREMATFMPAFADSIAHAQPVSLPRVYWSAFWNGSTFMTDPRFADRYERLGDVPGLLAVTDTTDLEAQARAARDLGVAGIKIITDLDPPAIDAIIGAADAAGLPVWGHATIFPTRPSDVVASGVDVISHSAFFVWEPLDELPRTYNEPHPWNVFGPPAPYATVAYDDPAILAVLDSMRSRGLILDPTLTLMTILSAESRDWAVNLTRLAHEREIPIAVGTDTFLIFDEIEALVDDVGLTPLEAITSATAVGAAVLGEEDAFGTLEVGKVADLAIYAADPSEDITVLRTPTHVLKGGDPVEVR